MKTEKFRLIRIFCRIFIIVLILSSISYMFFFFFYKNVFSIENTILMRSALTLRSFSLHITFLSIFISLLCGYALNIGSKGMIAFGMWLSIFLCLYCVFSMVYMKTYGLDRTINTLKMNPFSVDMNPYLLISTFGAQNILKAEEMFSDSYRRGFYYFSIFGMINTIGFVLLGIGLLSILFVKVHKEEQEDVKIETAVVENLTSLRGRRGIAVR